MTIKECVRKYTNDLKLVTHIPAKEVEILIMYLLDKNPIWLHLNYNKEFEKEFELKKLVLKRATNYPLEYITKRASFYGEQFIVNEGVLIPRPETEILVENAFNILKEQKDKKLILEIGTGSGIISVMLAVLLKNIKIIAVDINEKALELAKQNAIKFGVLERIDFRYSNLFENVIEDNIFMVVSNPPYIKDSYVLPKNVGFEPKNALFGGVIGDELLKDIIKSTEEKNIPYLLCEMGYDQKNSLEEYFKEFNVEFYSFYKDYENFDRGFTLKFKK
ncbi:peptide chain release factor N(5)-glutamine methyltransferase [Aliarcobacter cibarius]|uniref:peptide chain release factor N(5)-glutamine methyltransferase n=1 Tax=Aliarcobacter cibarius TaxID=255507 RepID=A0A5J6RLA6_9BACT|nr:peptide chain release factor N(5)-glutamine methyltransferase [Aliarcobacter cibarius]QEZ89171.1 protein-(glutamine-N5) methyltransferase [Aliarcobacter cibarius]QKJ27206.1 protein-(glutamine-N5) methyltransferase [Aliarcobacter cibarius]TLT01574.1 peptide chain release factor N(5)-glutamine methyltransferase [Aliarcobacter cibarius]TLT02065.1 peptide chain release factor N(5)-glutamine methyltransferase [Aliarcobacter cibarius]TLT04093.1 peptide chain release factor N(5)-glutamine methyltr